jgi:apolipoprotein N-acyltransferase
MPDYIAHNSLYVFDETGSIEARYDKMVPLPFGEYIPLSDTFPILKTIVQGPGDFKAGEEPVFFEVETAGGQPLRYTTPICYEAILQPTMRRLAGGGAPETTADFFVNITNDAWFGDTASPHQHAMLTAVQTVQVGRPMLRIAYTGISWIVEPHGDIRHETRPFTEEAEVVPLRVRRFDTVYSRGGWIFGWICVAGAVGFVVWGRRRETGQAVL